MAPEVNFTQTTLNGAINDTATTITLNSVTNVKTPGYAIINRENSAGTATPNAREVIYFTGISGNNLTGVTRATDGSTARSHSDGAIVEFVPTIGMWNSLVTIVSTGFTGDGYLKAIASPVSIARGEFTQFVTPSIASIARIQAREFASVSAASVYELRVATRADMSGASVTGIVGGNLHPIAYIPGFASGASTNAQRFMMPQGGNWLSFSIMTRTPVSTASLTIDINRNNPATSIFEAETRPAIFGGGTFVSTASLLTRAFSRGDFYFIDIDNGGNVSDLLVMGEGIG